MRKKKQISKKQISELINDYENNLLSSNILCEKYNIPKKRVLLILKENDVNVRSSGRLDLGGRKVADKKWRNNNKEYAAKKYKTWASENRKHLREYHKQWREKNIEHHRETRNKYERTRKASDPIYKLIANFRTAIYTVLKENDMTKSGHYFDVLGYSQEDLVTHLNSLLNDGMTWENYGEWHVDHKLPIDSFNFKDIYDSEFKKCWSLKNLQPMWGSENISKGTRIL